MAFADYDAAAYASLRAGLRFDTATIRHYDDAHAADDERRLFPGVRHDTLPAAAA